MRQSTKRFSSIIISIIFLIFAAVFFFDFDQQEYASFVQVKGEEHAQKDLVATANDIVNKVKQDLSSYSSDAAGAQAVNLAMPVGSGTSEALAQIYGLAANTGISVQSVGISYSNPDNLSSASGADTANPIGTVVPMESLTFNISATGSYEAFKAFLQGLEGNVRLFDVTQLSIRPTNSVGGSNTQDLFTYSLSAQAYYQPS